MKHLMMYINFILFCYFANAQDTKIIAIRDYYSGINKWKAEMEKEGLPYYHIITQNLMQPGSGIQKVKTVFYFNYKESDNKQNNYELIYELVKIEKDFNIAGMDFHCEFLFKNGEPIFIYQSQDPLLCGNKRYYYDNGKLIKLIINPFSDPCPEISAKYEKISGFSNFELDDAENFRKQALLLKQIFENLPKG